MRTVTILVAVLLVSSVALASPCTAPTIVPADGRIVDFDFVAPSSSNFYQFSATAGHSYSVEVRQDYDDVNTDLTTVLSGPAGTCPTPAALGGTNDTTAAEPALPSNASRSSFTATASGTHKIQVTNSNGSTGRYISVAVSDTTAYNNRWSTFSGFSTQWAFVNTTSQPINATLIAITTGGGSGTNTITFTVAANSQVFKTIGAGGADINNGGEKSGFATLTHDGPPGGLLADGYFIRGGTVFIIVPTSFLPIRDAR